jgi:hypothetical protein
MCPIYFRSSSCLRASANSCSLITPSFRSVFHFCSSSATENVEPSWNVLGAANSGELAFFDICESRQLGICRVRGGNQRKFSNTVTTTATMAANNNPPRRPLISSLSEDALVYSVRAAFSSACSWKIASEFSAIAWMSSVSDSSNFESVFGSVGISISCNCECAYKAPAKHDRAIAKPAASTNLVVLRTKAISPLLSERIKPKIKIATGRMPTIVRHNPTPSSAAKKRRRLSVAAAWLSSTSFDSCISTILSIACSPHRVGRYKAERNN